MILAAKDKNESYIALTTRDSLTFFDIKDSMITDNLPFCEVKGRKGLYIFFNRLNRAEELLRYNNEIFAEKISFQSIVNYTVPKIIEILGEEDLLEKEGTAWNNSLLIVYNGKIYTINNVLEVFEDEDVFVRSIAKTMVYGTLYSTSEQPIRQRFVEAIKLLKEVEAIDVLPLILFNVNTNTYKECWTLDDILTD